jgi:hypothetical protein
MGKSGVTQNRVLLGLEKVTATRQLKADAPSCTKPPSPIHIQKYRSKKKGISWTKEEIRKLYGTTYIRKRIPPIITRMCNEVWRQRNTDCRMNTDPKKFISQKKYIVENKMFTEQEIEEIVRKSEK